jgi:hypothetical protein
VATVLSHHRRRQAKAAEPRFFFAVVSEIQRDFPALLSHPVNYPARINPSWRLADMPLAQMIQQRDFLMTVLFGIDPPTPPAAHNNESVYEGEYRIETEARPAQG